jgi:hypothetical protein
MVLALLDRVRLAHPELALPLELLRETMGLGTMSLAAFRAWLGTAPCHLLEDAEVLELSLIRLRHVAETQARCPNHTVSILQHYTAKLPPRQLMEVLEPLTAEQLGWLLTELRLDVPERAEALVDWAVERQPELLYTLHLTIPVIRKLLSPRNAERLGGRDAVFDFMLRRGGDWNGQIEDDALEFLFREALRGTPPPDRVRDMAAYQLEPAGLSHLLEGVLHSPDARVRAAAAAGLAEHEGHTIPREAARACLAEVRVGFQCIEAVAQRMGPPPPGKRCVFRGCTGPRHLPPPPPQPLEDYCVRLEDETRSCNTACGGPRPANQVLTRLESAAQEPLSYPDAMRACAYSRP